jgi:hypothetical protein
VHERPFNPTPLCPLAAPGARPRRSESSRPMTGGAESSTGRPEGS